MHYAGLDGRELRGAERAAARRDLYRGSGRRFWLAVRRRVIARDKGICQDCRRPCARFHVHHIAPAFSRQGAGRELEISNLVTLCPECHMARHKELRMQEESARPSLALPSVRREWRGTIRQLISGGAAAGD